MDISCVYTLDNSKWDNVWYDSSRQRYILLRDKKFFIWSPWFKTSQSNNCESNYAKNLEECVAGYSYQIIHYPTNLLHANDLNFPMFLYELPSSNNIADALNFFKMNSDNVDSLVYAQLSLDAQLFAVQISDRKVIVSELKSNRSWTVEIKQSSENKILQQGMVWSDHGGNSQDLILVTKKGLELYKVSCARAQCKLSRTISHRVIASLYEPNFRLFLLGSPPSSSSSSFSSAEHLHVSSYEMHGYFLNVSNHSKEQSGLRLELLPPSKGPAFTLNLTKH